MGYRVRFTIDGPFVVESKTIHLLPKLFQILVRSLKNVVLVERPHPRVCPSLGKQTGKCSGVGRKLATIDHDIRKIEVIRDPYFLGRSFGGQKPGWDLFILCFPFDRVLAF